MHDETEQKSFVEEAHAQALAGDEIPSLPDLSSGQVLIIVEADERASDAVNILSRNNAVTGGVRTPQT